MTTNGGISVLSSLALMTSISSCLALTTFELIANATMNEINKYGFTSNISTYIYTLTNYLQRQYMNVYNGVSAWLGDSVKLSNVPRRAR